MNHQVSLGSELITSCLCWLVKNRTVSVSLLVEKHDFGSRQCISSHIPLCTASSEPYPYYFIFIICWQQFCQRFSKLSVYYCSPVVQSYYVFQFNRRIISNKLDKKVIYLDIIRYVSLPSHFNMVAVDSDEFCITLVFSCQLSPQV